MARDYNTIVSNVQKMLGKGAPDADIKNYLSYEGLNYSQFESLLEGPTVLGQAKEFVKGIPAGAVGMVESAGVGLAAALPEEYEQATRRKVQDIGASARSKFEAAPGYEETIARKGGEALGSTAPFFAMAPLGPVGFVGAGALATGAGAGEARLRAEQEGATEEERRLATGLGAGVGGTELLPVFGFLSKLSTPIRQGIISRVQRASVTGGMEGAQEAAAGLAQNLIAQGIYKPDQELIEGVGEQGAYGAGVGALIQGITDMALGRRAMKTTTEAGKVSPTDQVTEERPVPEPTTEVAKKLFLSYEDATLEIERLKQEEKTEETTARIKELEDIKKTLVVDSVNRLRAKPEEDIAAIREAGVGIEQAAGLKAEGLPTKGTQGEFRETLDLPKDFALQEQVDREAGIAGLETYKTNLADIVETRKLIEADTSLAKNVRKSLLDEVNKAERALKRDIKSESAKLGEVEVETEPEFSTVLAPEILKNVGLKPQSGFFKELAGLDMAVKEDASKVVDVLKRVRANQALSDSTKEGIEGVAMQAFNALATQQQLDIDTKKRAKKETVIEAPVQEEMALEPEVKDVRQDNEFVPGDVEPSVPVLGERGDAGIAGGAAVAEPSRMDTNIQTLGELTRRAEAVDPALALEQKAQEEIARREQEATTLATDIEKPAIPLDGRQLREYKDAAGFYLEKANYVGQKALNNLAGDLYAKENTTKAKRFQRGLSKAQRQYVESALQELKQYQRQGTIAIKRKDARLKIERARQAENPELVAKLEKELEAFNNKYKNAKLEREDLLGGVTPKLVEAVRAGDLGAALNEIVTDKTGAYNEMEKLVAKRLLANPGKLPKIRLVDASVLEGADGQYNPYTDTVEIARDQVDSHTVLHETVHGFLHGYITDFESGDIQIARGLTDLKAVYEHVQKVAPELAEQYGMENLTEFASEVMSNREFQNALKGIKYKRGNIFTEFARAVMRVLGLNPSQEMDALAAALVAADRSLATGRQYQETQISGKQQKPAVPVKRQLTPEGEEALELAKRMAGISNEKPKAPTMGMFGKLGSFFTDPAYRQEKIDAFRTKVAYRGASAERKLQDAYNGAIRDNLGEIRPDLFMTAAEHSDTLTVAAMKMGKLRLDKNVGWVAEEGPASMTGVFDTIHALGKRLGDQELAFKIANDAFIARRANALKKKDIIDASLLPDQNKIDAGLEAFKKFPELNEAFDQFTTFKNGLIDAMVDGGRLNKEDAQSWKDAVDYVPWNRIKDYEENTQASPKGFFKGLTNLGQMKKLKGGKEDEINNIFDNMVGLSFWMTNSAIRNHAGLKLTDAFIKNGLGARQVRTDMPGVNPNNVVFIYRDGTPEAYEFDSAMDVYAFKGVESLGGPMLDALTKASNFLRKTTTATPQFAVSQLFQDAYRGIALSGVRNPFSVPLKVMKGFVEEFTENDLGKKLESFGIVGAYDLMPGRAKDAIEKEFGIKQRSVTEKILNVLERPSIASDTALRKAVFQQTLNETKSAEFPEGDVLLARYRAQEIINFKRQGSDRNVALFRQIIPFMNAYIQGMDVLYRTMTGRGVAAHERDVAFKLFVSAGIKLTALSTIYTMLVAGDDEYEGLADYDKNKHFIIPGTGMKVPVAPEIGFMFKVIPERLYTYIATQGTERPEDAKKMLKGIGTAAFDSFTGPNLTPQAVKPTLEVLTNYSFFRDAPIVGMGMKNMEPRLQYTDSTSEIAKMLGNLANISPIKLDHLMRGYTGIAGGSVLDLSNAAFSDGPNKRIYEYPAFKTFMYDQVPSGFKQDFYTFRDQTSRVIDTVNGLKARGQVNEIFEYLGDPEKASLYMFKSTMSKIEQKLEDIRKMKKFVSGDKNLSSADKKDILERIELTENELIRMVNVPAMRRFARGE
jgi:hypothetical protein